MHSGHDRRLGVLNSNAEKITGSLRQSCNASRCPHDFPSGRVGQGDATPFALPTVPNLEIRALS